MYVAYVMAIKCVQYSKYIYIYLAVECLYVMCVYVGGGNFMVKPLALQEILCKSLCIKVSSKMLHMLNCS